MKRLLVFWLALLPWIVSFAVEKTEVSLSAEEAKLYALIMQYRAAQNLPAIPLSPALTYVAQVHVRDMQSHVRADGCNMHSWSDDGTWSAVCYTNEPTEDQMRGMWNKPRELTTYRGAGYELAHWCEAVATAQTAFLGWQGSEAHREMMVNAGSWKKVRWQAIGVGIYKGYAVVWLGEEKDPESGKSR